MLREARARDQARTRTHSCDIEEWEALEGPMVVRNWPMTKGSKDWSVVQSRRFQVYRSMTETLAAEDPPRQTHEMLESR